MDWWNSLNEKEKRNYILIMHDELYNGSDKFIKMHKLNKQTEKNIKNIEELRKTTYETKKDLTELIEKLLPFVDIDALDDEVEKIIKVCCTMLQEDKVISLLTLQHECIKNDVNFHQIRKLGIKRIKLIAQERNSMK
jgi:hypothetical protein